MSYRLGLSKLVDEKEPKKGAKYNVFFENLPPDSKVYILYYPGPKFKSGLAKELKALGESAGKNLFVNIAKRLDDPRYGMVAANFDITKFPTVIVTALDSLASPPADYSTAYVRIDDKDLLSSDKAFDLIQKIFNLFIAGKVAEAMRASSRDSRMFRLKGILNDALKGLKAWLNGRDINFYTALGRLELKSKK